MSLRPPQSRSDSDIVAELVGAALEGDRGAFAELHRRAHATVRGVLPVIAPIPVPVLIPAPVEPQPEATEPDETEPPPTAPASKRRRPKTPSRPIREAKPRSPSKKTVPLLKFKDPFDDIDTKKRERPADKSDPLDGLVNPFG